MHMQSLAAARTTLRACPFTRAHPPSGPPPSPVSSRHCQPHFQSSARQHSSMEASATGSTPTAPPEDPIVQYVVLRTDLWTSLKWPLGSVAAQACHASTAVQWMFKDDPVTQAYCADLDHMRKVVLEVKDQAALTNLSAKLTEAGILHKLWVEQPEDVPTSLATKPYPKSVIGPHLKKLQLCKTPVGKQ